MVAFAIVHSKLDPARGSGEGYPEVFRRAGPSERRPGTVPGGPAGRKAGDWPPLGPPARAGSDRRDAERNLPSARPPSPCREAGRPLRGLTNRRGHDGTHVHRPIESRGILETLGNSSRPRRGWNFRPCLARAPRRLCEPPQLDRMRLEARSSSASRSVGAHDARCTLLVAFAAR